MTSTDHNDALAPDFSEEPLDLHADSSGGSAAADEPQATGSPQASGSPQATGSEAGEAQPAETQTAASPMSDAPEEGGHMDSFSSDDLEGDFEGGSFDDEDDFAAPPVEEPEERDDYHFDISDAEIQSFTQLRGYRAEIFAKRRRVNRFEDQLAQLSDDGEMGRRKGLGLWMIGKFAESESLLAKHEGDAIAAFTRGQSLLALGEPQKAASIFEALSQKHAEAAEPRAFMLEARFEAALQNAGSVWEKQEVAANELLQAVDAAPESFRESAPSHYLQGRAKETLLERQDALDCYDRARQIDPLHRGMLFRLGHLSERSGLDELALECYEALVAMRPADRRILLNLGVLYEDLGRDQDAAACYDIIHRYMPSDVRTRLFLEDARQGMDMYYDEDMERKEDRLNQILRIPITDFELSVRARNCLNKMDINTLGDLVRKTETELLAYKNFGETSLNEIKEILASKGLRLGMAREEAVASIESARRRYAGDENAEILSKPIAELELSIRARRTVEGLGCLTIGDVTQHSEEELLGMPNFGVTSLQELKNKLSEMNIKLKSKK